MTFEKAQQNFIDSFNSLGDWFSQYSLLLQIAGDAPIPAPEEKTENNRIHGCENRAYLVLEDKGGRLSIAVDSESLLIRGVLGVYAMLCQDRTMKELAEAKFRFIEETALKEQLSTDRFAGMYLPAKLIRNFAKGHLL